MQTLYSITDYVLKKLPKNYWEFEFFDISYQELENFPGIYVNKIVRFSGENQFFILQIKEKFLSQYRESKIFKGKQELTNRESIMNSIKQTLIDRDNLSAIEADTLITEARNDFYNRLAEGEMPFDFCEEAFGLEPDYLEDLI